MKNIENWIIKRTGTSFKGYLYASYSEIECVFGEPIVNPNNHKTDAEWLIETPYGTATIYNYKNGKSYLGDKGFETTLIAEWHIGGNDDRVAPYIKSKINSQIIRRFS